MPETRKKSRRTGGIRTKAWAIRRPKGGRLTCHIAGRVTAKGCCQTDYFSPALYMFNISIKSISISILTSSDISIKSILISMSVSVSMSNNNRHHGLGIGLKICFSFLARVLIQYINCVVSQSNPDTRICPRQGLLSV